MADVLIRLALCGLLLVVCGFAVVLWLRMRHVANLAAKLSGGALICPACGAGISERDPRYSVTCQNCFRHFRYESLASNAAALSNPPFGASFEPLSDGFTVTVGMRSWLAFLFVPVTLFVLWAVYKVLRAPAVGAVGSFGLLAFAAMFVCLCLVILAGRLRITSRGDRLAMFWGLGRIGLTSSYRWSSFRTVYEELPFNSGPILVLLGEGRVTFGSVLAQKQRDFLLEALRAHFEGPRTAGRTR